MYKKVKSNRVFLRQNAQMTIRLNNCSPPSKTEKPPDRKAVRGFEGSGQGHFAMVLARHWGASTASIQMSLMEVQPDTAVAAADWVTVLAPRNLSSFQ